MESVTADVSETAVDAWARLIRVSQQLLNSVEADLKAAKLPPLTWYDALLELDRAPDQGLRPFQLQERMLLAQYNLSRLIDRLADAGLVARDACESDGRGQVVRITPAGQVMLADMWATYKASIARHFARKLTEAELVSLAAILNTLKTG